MLKSMTGFGRGEAKNEGKYFLAEVKTVNNRYMDINVKMPRKFIYLEDNIKQTIKNHIKRGRVDVFINFEYIGESDIKIDTDLFLAKEYLKALTELQRELKIENDITLSLIAGFPEVIKIKHKESDEEEVWGCLREALIHAVDNLMEMRFHEGNKLKADLLNRLDAIEGLTKQIEIRSPEITLEYKKRLIKRLQEIMEEGYDLEAQENRIVLEVALFADKSSITEELVRLKSHIYQFKNSLNDREPVGRKLDFIVQEMVREVNTIGSKANDIIISNMSVEIKSELEKIREQVQNIE